MTRFLMCPPDYYKVSYKINPWMQPEAWRPADRDGAWSEWNRLVAVLDAGDAKITTLKPQPHLPDMVFTANHGVVLDAKFMAPNFKCPERQPERPHIIDFFMTFPGINDIGLTRLRFEGAGDCIWDGRLGVFWFGFGQRSDEAVKQEIATFFGVPVIALELIDPRFYHLDTAFMVLPRGEVLYHPIAFAPKSRAAILNTVPTVIAIEEDDANNFSANCIGLGDILVMSHCSLLLEKRLNDLGYNVVRCPLPTFHKSGGSAYCLTLRLE